MQTTINAKMAFGIPGTHGNTQPFYTDPAIAGSSIEMGLLVTVTNGKAELATASAFDGIAVDPHEHVLAILPPDADHQKIIVDAGDNIAVAKKGCWFVKVYASTLPGVGDTVYAAASGKITTTTGTKTVGTIVDVDYALQGADDAKYAIALVRLS